MMVDAAKKYILILIFIICGLCAFADLEEKSLSFEFNTGELKYCKVGFTSQETVVNFSTVDEVNYTEESPLSLVISEFEDGSVRLKNISAIYLYTQLIYAAPLSITVRVVGNLVSDSGKEIPWQVALAKDGNYGESITITHLKDDQNILKLGTYELAFRSDDLRGKTADDYKGIAILEVVTIE